MSSVDKLHKYDRHTQQMFSLSLPFKPAASYCERYIYRPVSPALLQTNRTLRRGSVDIYISSARIHITRYEAEHETALRKYCELCWYLNAVKSGFVSYYRGPDTLEILKKEMEELFSGMLERVLRWYVLRESCILVRSGPEPV